MSQNFFFRLLKFSFDKAFSFGKDSTNFLFHGNSWFLFFGSFWHFTKIQKEPHHGSGKIFPLFCKNKKIERTFENETARGKGILAVTPLLLLAVILNFNITNCSSFSLNGKPTGVAPWKVGLLALSASGSKATSSSSNSDDDDPLIFGNSEKSTTGFVFVHTNNLGSVTNFTDGNGDLVTGGQFEGASDIKYLPYGTIDQKNSKGPKLSAFTFTGQREETSTGLMYYNFRYYDASIGRFVSPDDRIFPDKLSGMNKYMYVGGNPVMMNDPTGHKGNAWVHMANQLIKRGMKEVAFQAQRNFINSLSPELRMAVGYLSSSSSSKNISRFGKVGKGLLWGGSMLAMAGSPAGYLAFSAGTGVAYGLATNYKAFMSKPFYATRAYMYGGLDFGLGMALNPLQGNPLPSLENYSGGGVAIHNSFYSNNTTGSLAFTKGGPVSHLDTGASRATYYHEGGHVDQFNTGWSKNGRESGWSETEADLKAGTMRYVETQFLLYMLLKDKNLELYNSFLNYNLYLSQSDSKTKQMLIINFFLTNVFPPKKGAR